MINIRNTNDSRITITGGMRILCKNTETFSCECGNPLTKEDKEVGMCKECDEVMWHSTQFHPNER